MRKPRRALPRARELKLDSFRVAPHHMRRALPRARELKRCALWRGRDRCHVAPSHGRVS